MVGVLIEYAKQSGNPDDEECQQATSMVVFKCQPVQHMHSCLNRHDAMRYDAHYTKYEKKLNRQTASSAKHDKPAGLYECEMKPRYLAFKASFCSVSTDVQGRKLIAAQQYDFDVTRSTFCKLREDVRISSQSLIAIMCRGVNPAGDRGTRPPQMSNGGTAIRHVPQNMAHICFSFSWPVII